MDGLTGYDAIIRVEDWAWSRLGPAEQEALVAHELCHGSMSEKGALRVVKHDLEEFGFVVRKYGAWQEGIALFDKQLAMFEPGLGTSAPVEGEQTVVPFKTRATARGTAARLADRVIPAGTVDDDLLPGENLGACPWPGCELALEHPGAHQTAADDTPAKDGAE